MKKSTSKIILGIETSCDDTGIALLKVSETKTETKFEVLANEISSQIELHQQYGGVFPAMAKREHARNIVPLFIHALEQSTLLKKRKKALVVPEKIQKNLRKILTRETELIDPLIYFLETYEQPKVDEIIVTSGPGLEPTLWVGINFAQALGTLWDIKVMPANHMEGHIVSTFIPESKEQRARFSIKPKALELKALALLVSGGHTELVTINGIGKYKVVGATRDDAAGEAFDKIARMMDLPYPGGPEISRLAHEARTTLAFSEFSFPRPMLHSPDFDFSFSGLKTAVLYKIRDMKKLSETQKKDLARECEDAIVEVLVTKTLRATMKYNPQSIIIGGGVAANKMLREELVRRAQEFNPKLTVHFPTPILSRDNALMIALAGYLKLKRVKKYPRTIVAVGDLKLS